MPQYTFAQEIRMKMRKVKFVTVSIDKICRNFYSLVLIYLFSIFQYVIASMNGIPEASMEVDVAKGRRDWAFSERDKVK